ncbi:MAG: hypothetical protein AMJ90_06915 [candidate division Zixibacteria bacterium SM23_73_2]|nr:MAG: hypothetical protein AMJ90_06915 [candidate division Zixibacteria bacterium SM23_73_2]
MKQPPITINHNQFYDDEFKYEVIIDFGNNSFIIQRCMDIETAEKEKQRFIDGWNNYLKEN